MPSIEGSINGKRQLVLPVAVLGSRNPSDLTHVECHALLDTGATSSGIGPQVIEELDLLSHQKKPLSVATEMRMVGYYLFRLGFFAKGESAQNNPPYIFAETDGFSWAERKSFDVIIGMDVISQCDLMINRNGKWKLTFG